MATIEVGFNLFPQLGAQFDSVRASAFRSGIAAGVAAADARTPRDTGALVANKSIEVSPDEASITWNQHYAPYQNFGTSRGVPAHGFAEAALDAARPVIEAELARFGG